MPESASGQTPVAPTPVGSASPSPQGRKIQLTPELIEKITARVYAMLMADARIERERLRLSTQKTPGTDGGRHAV
jgi:hypothetical protein